MKKMLYIFSVSILLTGCVSDKKLQLSSPDISTRSVVTYTLIAYTSYGNNYVGVYEGSDKSIKICKDSPEYKDPVTLEVVDVCGNTCIRDIRIRSTVEINNGMLNNECL